MGGDKEVGGPSSLVAVVSPSGPAPPGHDGFKAVQHPMTDHRGDETSLRDPGRGWEQGAAVETTTAEPLRSHLLVHGEGLLSP
jgi:hypothetical protein